MLFIHQPVFKRRFADNRAHRQTGRKTCVRILEDHLHIRAKLIKLPFGNFRNFLSFEINFAARYVVKAQIRTPHRRFTATRFPNDSERFPFLQREGNVIHRLQMLSGFPDEVLANYEIFLQVLDFQNHVVFGSGLVRLYHRLCYFRRFRLFGNFGRRKSVQTENYLFRPCFVTFLFEFKRKINVFRTGNDGNFRSLFDAELVHKSAMLL